MLFERYSNRFVVDWFDAWEITDGGPDPCFTSGISVAMAHQMYTPGFYTWGWEQRTSLCAKLELGR